MSEVKISELEETTTVQEGCCFPIVTEGVTKKITYGTLAEKLNTIIEPEWTKVKNKPSTYAPSAHTHQQSDVTGLDTALNNKQNKLTAGTGIKIENDVISATGGGTGGGAVDSVNGKTGAVVLNAGDVGAVAEPTNEGTSGQVLTTDGNGGRTWTTVSGGGSGAVNSVNGKTGTVVLTPSDIGAVATEEGKGLSTNDYDDTEKQNNASNTASRHTHSNKSVLDNTTASFTTEEKTKLAGIETGAEANTVDSVNGKTGAVNLSANDVGALPATTEIPTKTSDLQNDSGYITGYTETDPTVPSWAKESTKPSYTPAEVGAMPASTVVTAFWQGTQSEYDALTSKDTTTLYLIKEG